MRMELTIRCHSITMYLALLNIYNRGDFVEDKFLQQLKKGVLEMLVLNTICKKTTYGYELMAELKAQLID